MNVSKHNQHSTQQLLGLKALEQVMTQDDFIYIVQSLYRIIFTAKARKENKQQLLRRIKRFEKQSELPGYLSSTPMAVLFEQLEDAQFYYRIKKQEVTLPTFN